jgi:dTDP-4-amino-4,6-dideoxygalactose transaminase
LLAELLVMNPWQHLDSYSGLHLYVIRLKPSEIKKSRDKVFEALRAAYIGVSLHTSRFTSNLIMKGRVSIRATALKRNGIIRRPSTYLCIQG